MTREETIKSALKFLVRKQQEQGSWGYSDNDNNNEVSWDEVIKWIDRWIPVSERLPEADVDVLVTDNGGGVPTVIIDACGIKDDTGERFWYTSQTPVAWMEWPVPYKAGSEV